MSKTWKITYYFKGKQMKTKPICEDLKNTFTLCISWKELTKKMTLALEEKLHFHVKNYMIILG